MSVSFYPEITDTPKPHLIACDCGAWAGAVEYPSRQFALNAIASTAEVSACVNDYCDGLCVEPVSPEPEVNFANLRAGEVLDLLGIQVGEDFSDRYIGSLPASDFKGRVLMAIALAPKDEGMPAYQAEMPIWGKVTVAPREAGYYNTRLEALLVVADFALANGREVVWG